MTSSKLYSVESASSLMGWLLGVLMMTIGNSAHAQSSPAYVIGLDGYVMVVSISTGQVDLCPNTPLGEVEDALGCSASERDSDVDGIVDSEDICPTTTSGDVANHLGCSQAEMDVLNAQDEDSDSVPDYLDQCSGTPTNETPDANGCTPDQIDSDDDGTPDYQDAYPHQSATQCT